MHGYHCQDQPCDSLLRGTRPLIRGLKQPFLVLPAILLHHRTRRRFTSVNLAVFFPARAFRPSVWLFCTQGEKWQSMPIAPGRPPSRGRGSKHLLGKHAAAAIASSRLGVTRG